MALGMLIVIVAGHIDLSVGSVMGFIGALAAVMVVNWDVSIGVTMATCVAVGALIGGAQGYWIAYWKIPSFIVTLAGMLVFRGLSLWLLEGQSVGPFPRDFQVIATGFVPDILPGSEAFKSLFGTRNFNVLAFATGLIAAASGPACASARITRPTGSRTSRAPFSSREPPSSHSRWSSCSTNWPRFAACPTCF
jgi:putative multiple sugar transport system permease protein